MMLGSRVEELGVEYPYCFLGVRDDDSMAISGRGGGSVGAVIANDGNAGSGKGNPAIPPDLFDGNPGLLRDVHRLGMNEAKSAAGFVPSFDELWGEDWADAGPGVAIVLVNVGGKVYDILCDLSILYKGLNEVGRVKDEDTPYCSHPFNTLCFLLGYGFGDQVG